MDTLLDMTVLDNSSGEHWGNTPGMTQKTSVKLGPCRSNEIGPRKIRCVEYDRVQ